MNKHASEVLVEYTPDAMKLADIAPRYAMPHSGELKPIIFTADHSEAPTAMQAFPNESISALS